MTAGVPGGASPKPPICLGSRPGPRNGKPWPFGHCPRPHALRPARGWPSRPTCHPLPLPLQEVVSHCKKLTKKNKEQLSDMMVLDKQKGLKSLSKEKRQKLEAYQHLFYLLQVSGGLGRGFSTIP